MDFFNVRKEFKKVYLKVNSKVHLIRLYYDVVFQGPQTMGRVKRSEFDEAPPETDPSLYVTDAEWKEYITKQEKKLQRQAVESVHGTSDANTVVRSAMSGIEGLTMADTLTIPAMAAATEVTQCKVMGRNFKTPTMEPTMAMQRLALHDKQVHRVAQLACPKLM